MRPKSAFLFLIQPLCHLCVQWQWGSKRQFWLLPLLCLQACLSFPSPSLTKCLDFLSNAVIGLAFLPILPFIHPKALGKILSCIIGRLQNNLFDPYKVLRGWNFTLEDTAEWLTNQCHLYSCYTQSKGRFESPHWILGRYQCYMLHLQAPETS